MYLISEVSEIYFKDFFKLKVFKQVSFIVCKNIHNGHESTGKITIAFYCLVAYLILVGVKYTFENISISVFAADILTKYFVFELRSFKTVFW